MLQILRKNIFETREEQYSREMARRFLLKGTAIIMLAPSMMLLLMAFYGRIDLIDAIYGATFVFVMSIIFVRPYIANLSALTTYVRELSLDKNAEKPDLTFLNNVEELTEAVSQLHNSWENRKIQLEAKIAESRILIDSLPDVLIMLDSNFNIIQTNSTAKELFGGKYFNETLKKIINNPELNSVMKNVMQHKQERNINYFMPKPFSRHYMVHIEKFPTYSPGGIALMIVMYDVTAMKNTEQLLSDFVANASHEIRTPLTSIIGFVETLQTSARDDFEVREEFLEIIRCQAERMSKLVKDLLSLSQIERNLYTRATGKVFLDRILKDVIASMKMSADDKNINICLNIDGKLPDATGDSGEMMQVFENLIGNAIKYGKEWTDITVNARKVDNTFPTEKLLKGYKKLISIEVKDCGIGISKDNIPRITERFYRVDTAHSRRIQGTGLGLAIVKYILERHGGVLEIKSVIDKGSSFRVLLPINKYE